MIKQEYQHRTATKTLPLTDANGDPIKNRQVVVNQTKHKFLFGCGAFQTVPLLNDELAGDEKRLMETRYEKWLEIFNMATSYNGITTPFTLDKEGDSLVSLRFGL